MDVVETTVGIVVVVMEGRTGMVALTVGMVGMLSVGREVIPVVV